jgi:hypothetical protein
VQRVQENHQVLLNTGVPNCHEERAELNVTFYETYEELAELLDERNQSLHDNFTICLSDATYRYKYGVEGPDKIDDTIETAAEKIHFAQLEIAKLEPRLHDVEHAVVRMRKYIDELNDTCEVTGEITKHLALIRGLIIELQECPGRNDFTITIPHWVHPDATTPSPTPWQERSGVCADTNRDADTNEEVLHCQTRGGKAIECNEDRDCEETRGDGFSKVVCYKGGAQNTDTVPLHKYDGELVQQKENDHIHYTWETTCPEGTFVHPGGGEYPLKMPTVEMVNWGA